MNLVVFDIGGTSVKYGLYQDDSIEKKSSFATPKTWDEMKENLYQVFKELSDADTKGVAISSPGAVDTEEGVIKGLSAIPYIHRFKIVDELEALFGLPVAIENDANCAGLAESKFGIGQDSKNALYFIIGSGIGENGQLYKGSSLFGGEFGYMIIENGKTLSTLASPVQVADRYAKAHGLTDFSGKDLFDLAVEMKKLRLLWQACMMLWLLVFSIALSASTQIWSVSVAVSQFDQIWYLNLINVFKN